MPKRSHRWHPETFACAFEGHATPAADVVRLRPEDTGLGVDLEDGRRMARCVRCDAWVVAKPYGPGAPETLPPLAELHIPRRGKALKEAIILRLIAVDRALHAIIFGALAVGLYLLEHSLPAVRKQATDLLNRLDPVLTGHTSSSSETFFAQLLHRVLKLNGNAIKLFLITALIYFVVEGLEAIGLWRQRRWAEYLTAVATAGFLPFEIEELIKKVTVLRVSALVVNLAILAYLVWAKRLFGVRGGAAAEAEEMDREQLLGPPQPGPAGEDSVATIATRT